MFLFLNVILSKILQIKHINVFSNSVQALGETTTGNFVKHIMISSKNKCFLQNKY